MLNKESRKYFQRAFAVSGTAIRSNADHAELIQKYSTFNKTGKLIDFLRTESSIALLNISYLETADDLFVWSPVIEGNHTKDAFLTRTPKEIYSDSTEEAPIMDTLFSFTAQVFLISKFK